MAPGLKWYLRSGSATSHGTGTAMYQVTSPTSHETHNSSPRVLSRWGAKPASAAPFCPATTVDVGSCYFCRRASAVIIQHGRQRKGHKRKFIFSSLKLVASSLFILLIYSILCIASVSRWAPYRKTRHRRMNHAHMGSECPTLEGRGQFKLGRGCLSSSSTLCHR